MYPAVSYPSCRIQSLFVDDQAHQGHDGAWDDGVSSVKARSIDGGDTPREQKNREPDRRPNDLEYNIRWDFK